MTRDILLNDILSDGASEGSILGSLVILVTVVTVGICM